jgi:phage terminase large subunit-like protein
MIKRQSVKLRVYKATRNGAVDGEPVLMSRESLAQKRRDMGPYTFGCQVLQDPKAEFTQGFKEAWLRHYRDINKGKGLNKYIVVDPASEKKRDSDYTVMWVIGLGCDENYYILDGLRDRLNLTERAHALFDLFKQWRPLKVGYEKYGMQADVEHIRDRQERENYRFQIVELGGSVPKPDRIKRLVPVFEQGRFYLPPDFRKTDYQGLSHDLISEFIDEEYRAFPVSAHDDMLVQCRGYWMLISVLCGRVSSGISPSTTRGWV